MSVTSILRPKCFHLNTRLIKRRHQCLVFVNVPWLTQQSTDMIISVAGWLRSTNKHSEHTKFLSVTVFSAQTDCFSIGQAVEVNWVYSRIYLLKPWSCKSAANSTVWKYNLLHHWSCVSWREYSRLYDSIQQRLWRATKSSGDQEMPHTYGVRRFITVFTTVLY